MQVFSATAPDTLPAIARKDLSSQSVPIALATASLLPSAFQLLVIGFPFFIGFLATFPCFDRFIG